MGLVKIDAIDPAYHTGPYSFGSTRPRRLLGISGGLGQKRKILQDDGHGSTAMLQVPGRAVGVEGSLDPVIRILVSSCLLGNAVRHNGRGARIEDAILSKWQQEGRVVAFCPELAGGFAVPRPAAEIVRGDGLAVWEGKAEVMENTGRNVTRLFVKGAKEALEKAKELNVRLAVLTDGSPSCGTSYIHDGTFEVGTRPGFGVTAALLERNGIAAFSEKRLSEAAEFLLNVQSLR